MLFATTGTYPVDEIHCDSIFSIIIFFLVESRERKSKDRVNDVADLYCCYGKRNNEYLAIFDFYDTGNVRRRRYGQKICGSCCFL
jgi:hypothetical protein